MSIVEYNRKTASQLLYNKDVSMIDSILERRTERFLPRQQRNGIQPSQLVEFEISTDQFLDMQTLSLNFDLSITGGPGPNPADNATAQNAAKILNGADIVERISIFYNDIPLEKVDMDANKWANIFLSHTVSDSYIKGEGSALLGYVPTADYKAYEREPEVKAAAGPPYIFNKYTYSVPMGIYSGVCRIHYFLPVVGNRIRIQLMTAPPYQVINFGAPTLSYEINNVSLVVDSVIVHDEYRRAVLSAISSSDGFRIPYTTIYNGRLSAQNSTEQNLKVTHNLSNACSLHLAYDNVSTKTTAPAAEYSFHCQSFPLSTFSSFSCRSGSRVFTGPDDIKSFPELYSNNEKCINTLNNWAGSGVISYKRFKQGYARNADMANAAAQYGCCLLSCNLEKVIANDDSDDVINSGISATERGATNEFNIVIRTTAQLAALDNWLYSLVHKASLVFKSGGVAVEA